MLKKVVKNLLLGVTTLSIISVGIRTQFVIAQETTTISSEADSNNDVESNVEMKDSFVGVWKNNQNQEISISPQKFMMEGKINKIKDILFEEQEESIQAILKFEELENQELRYEPTQDILNINGIDYIQEINTNMVNYVKDKLSSMQPINLEQLLEVDDHYLMAYFSQARVESENLVDQMAYIYFVLAEDFPELDLLTGEDYKDYQSLASKLEQSSTYTYSTLNNALPRDILNYYRELKKAEEVKDQEIFQKLLIKVDEAFKAYEKRRAQSSREYLLPYQWPEEAKALDSGDPYLLDESEYQLRDGNFSKEEAYTILVKATGYSVNFESGYSVQDGNYYAFPINGVIYNVFADGEINSNKGDVFNRNFEDRLAESNQQEEQNNTLNYEESDANLTVPEASRLYPNAVIKPFEPDIAFNYLLGKEELPSDAYFSDFSFNPAEGSYTLTVSSREKMKDPNYTAEEAFIAVYVVFYDGTYYIK